jgi:Zn-finger nucleic acid-binding protein
MSVYREARRAANTCPRCQETLLETPARAGVKYCEKCGGVFADLVVSNRILEAMDRQLLAIGFEASYGKRKPKDDGRFITCPECQIDMVKTRIESAACDIDACPLHGTWFDTGEMVDVMRALERARKKGIHLTRTQREPVNLQSPIEEPAPSLFDFLDHWLG